MGADSTHNLTVVWKQQGLDQVTSSMNNFSKTSQTTAKAQDALGKSMDSTAKSATKTSQEFTKTGKAAQTTGKQTQTLGQAFKSSSLMIAAFASSLVNTYQSIDSLMDQEMQLNRMRATLDKQTTQLQIAEANLKKKYDEGKISGEAYRLQSEKLASQREILKVKEEQYADAVQDNKTAWLSMATSVIPTVITGFTSLSNIAGSLKTTFDSTATSTGTLTTAKKALGTAVGAVTTAFTPFSTAIKNLLPDLKTTTDTVGAANSNNTVVGNMGALNTAFLDSERSGNTFTNTFKKIGDAIKNLPNTFKNIGSSIKDFFANFGTNIQKIPGLLKSAATAVIDFGKAMVMAIISNPILAAITAISVAVLALITNFGGFRDMMNGVGVAIGNALPFLKGFLDWFGQGANAALDAAAALLGFDTQAKKTGQTAGQTAKAMDPLLVALDRYLVLGGKFEKVSEIERHFVNARVEITKLGTQVDSSGKLMAGAMTAFANVFTTAMADIPNKSELVKNAIQAVYNVIKILDKGGTDAATAQKLLTQALNAVSNAAGTEVTQIEKSVVAQQKANEAAAAGGKVMTQAEKTINDYVNSQKNAEVQFNDFAVAYVEGNYDMIEAMGLSDEEIQKLMERFKKDFPDGAKVVEDSGKKIVESLAYVRDQGTKGMQTMGKVFADVAKDIKSTLPASLLDVTTAITEMSKKEQYMADVSKLAASGITNDKEKLKQAVLDLAKKYNISGEEITNVIQDIVNETENQTKEQDKANKKTDETIQKIQNLGQTRQQEIQTMKAETAQAQLLIKQLGIQNDVQGMTGKGLLQLIKNYDDMSNSLGIAADNVGLWWSELQKAQKIEEDERQILLDFAEAHKVTIPDAIKQGSIEGIKAFIEETLKMGPAAEKAKNELLKQFDEIKNGVQSLAEKQVSDLEKAFGESFKAGKKALKELGYEIDSLAAKKAMVNVGINSEEAEDGIVSLREMMVSTINGARGDIESIDFRGPAMAWREQMREEFDKAPAEVQAVFDKIIAFAEQNGGAGGTQYGAALIAAISAATGQGIPEISKMFGQITGAGTAELQAKANEFFKSTQTGITNPVISGLQGLSSGMSGVVNQSQADAINQIFGGKAEFQAAGADLAESTASGYESGSYLFPTAGEKAMYELLQTYDSAGAEAYAKAHGIATQTTEGLGTMQQTVPSAGEMAMYKLLQQYDTAGAEAYAKAHGIATQTGQGIASGSGEVTTGAQTGIVNPITGQVSTIPGQAQTALAPIEGVFSQAFLAASTTASSQLNILLAGVHATADATNQAFSTMSTSVATYSKSMGANIAAFASSSQTSFGTVATSTKTVHTALSGMSTSVKTYMSSMTTAISGFATKSSSSFKTVGSAATTAGNNIKTMGSTVSSAMSSMQSKVSSFASAFSSSLSKVKSQADSATKSVQALAKAINSLKDKRINVYVGLTGPGANFVRHGGAFISPTPTGFAQHGASFINTKPRKIGGVNVSEFGKPELVIVKPLSDTGDPTDKTIGIDVPVPLLTQPVPPAIQQQQGGGVGGGNQPIRVSGNITNTIILPDGKVLATEVKKYLLDNFSGIT